MNRKSLVSLIILDMVVMALALGLIVFRYQSLTRIQELKKEIIGDMKPAAATPAAPASKPATAAPARGNDDEGKQEILPAVETRNIGFSYRSSKARRVQIIGDFNDWIPTPLTRGRDFKWSISVPLQPGEYAYNYVVDGKPIRDPNNAKVCDVGRGFPNSYLKVKPLSNEKD